MSLTGSWTKQTDSSTNIRAFAGAAFDKTLQYILTVNGVTAPLLLSQDGGQTFPSPAASVTQLWTGFAMARDASLMFGISRSNVYKSTDKFATKTDISSGFGNFGGTNYPGATDCCDDGSVLAVGCTNFSGNQINVYSGGTWVVTTLATSGFGNLVVAVKPDGSKIVVIDQASGKVYQASYSSWSSWTVVQTLTGPGAFAKYSPDGSKLLLGTSSGMLISTDDGATTTSAGSGFTSPGVIAWTNNSVAFAGAGNSGTNGVYGTPDLSTWSLQSGPSTGITYNTIGCSTDGSNKIIAINWNGSAGETWTGSVNPPATTTTAITSSSGSTPISVADGTNVPLTATVTGSSPTGTITWKDNGTSIGVGTLTAGVVAYTYSTSGFAVSTHTITGVYSGDSGNAGSTSAGFIVIVKNPSTTSETVSSATSTFGTSVTFSATVTGVVTADGQPTGTITFSDAGTSIGTGTITGDITSNLDFRLPLDEGTGTTIHNSSGSAYATLSGTTSWVTGKIGLYAVSFGGGYLVTSTGVAGGSAPKSFSAWVKTTSTTGTIVASGQALSAEDFYLYITASNTIRLDISGAYVEWTCPNLTDGNWHQIVVSCGSTLSSVNVYCDGMAASVAGSSNPTTAFFTDSSDIWIGIYHDVTTNPLTGTIDDPRWYARALSSADTAALYLYPVSKVTFATSSLAAGVHTITASYSGDASYAASSGTVTETVLGTTTTALTVSANPSPFGVAVTLTGTIAGGSSPTGTIAFVEGASTLGTGVLSGTVATFSTSGLPIGSHTITAQYLGDGSNAGSTSSSVTLNVKYSTTTSVTPSSSSVTFGTGVTLTATVASSGTPTGTVTFFDGLVSIGSGAISGGSITSVYSLPAVGNHTITAVYSGDGSNLGSTSTTSVFAVGQVTSTTALTSSPASPATVTFGTSVTFSASVTGATASPGPTGTVVFKEGTTTLGTGVLGTAVSGVALTTFTTTALAGNATHTVSAVYAGDTNDTSSTSSTVTVLVNGIGSTTTLTKNRNPSAFGDPVTFSVSVTGSGTTPTGTITWSIDGTSVSSGTLDGSGGATYSTSALTAGTHTIAASYGGDGQYSASSGSLLCVVPIWAPRRRQEDVQEQEETMETPRPHSPLVYVPFFASARGLYRIFNTALYRFYWSNSGPPVAGSTPQATHSTLNFTTPSGFADGTWYLSVSYFDGILDSGFLPIGPGGQTYLTMVISGGAASPTAPTAPAGLGLRQLAGGIPQIVGYYIPAPDGLNAATQWAIAYTTDGTTPAAGSPSITPNMPKTGTALLSYNLPAQIGGTVVKVLVQTRRALSPSGFAYSSLGAVMTLTIDTAGPSAPLVLNDWAGALPENPS